MTGLASFFAFVFIIGNLIATVIEGGGFAATNLTAACDLDDTTLTVTTTTGFLDGDVEHPAYIQIGSEVVSYTGSTDTTLTGCSRGVADPQSGRVGEVAAHSIGTKVQTLNIATVDSIIGYNITTSGADFGFLDAIKLSGGFFKNLPKMLAWDYPWFQGAAVIIRFPLFALSAGFIFGIAMIMLSLAQSIWRT